MKTTILICGLAFITRTSSVAQETWEQKTNFQGLPRRGSVSFSIDGSGYLGTGTSGATSLQDFWKWDPQVNIWTQVANFDGGPRNGAVEKKEPGQLGFQLITTDIWVQEKIQPI